MPQIAEQITSLEQELELRIEWLEKGLKEIANGRDDMNPLYLKQQAQAILDGEPTTADKYNAKAKLELEKVNRGLDTMKEDEKLVYEDDMRQYEKDGLLEIVEFPEVNNIPENTVRISDINKEIAKEWNRDREEKINKESN